MGMAEWLPTRVDFHLDKEGVWQAVVAAAANTFWF